VNPDDSGGDIPLVDHLMSGLALFGLKYPSLLQFDQDRHSETKRANLKDLYGIERAPCDTRFRERLDGLDPRQLRPLYKALFSALQRGKGLEGFSYLDGHYLLSVDGTGYFSSPTIHCEQCCEKHHRNGTITYYHQMLGAVLVHPDHKEVFPLAPEPILKQDGAKKNDCERNAAKRLLEDVRREHPHLKLIVIEDGAGLQRPAHPPVAGAGPAFHPRRQAGRPQVPVRVGQHDAGHRRTHDSTDEDGTRHRFRYLNGAPLNDANFDLEVNFLEYWETKPDGKVTHFSWVTDFRIDPTNLMTLMRGARARWKIENETFNTLKNQGYHFEHNFGHGNQNLSTVLMHLMMLAFLIDQIQQRGCRLFQRRSGRAARPASGAAAQLLRHLPDPGLGDPLPLHHGQGAQGRPSRDLGLDGAGKGARDLGDLVGDAVPVSRQHRQSARYPRPPGFLRGYLSHPDRGRFGADGDRRGQRCRGADDQADGGLSAARHARF
jgi:hypothetical protein